MTTHTFGVPTPPTLGKQVLSLAAAPRGLPVQPFARRNNGKWAYYSDQQRESLLRSVYELTQDLWDMHADPMPGEVSAPEEYRERPGRISVNHLRRWVALWSVAYADPPSRTFYFKGERLREGATLEALQSLYRAANVDGALAIVDGDMRLYHTSILRPWWDADHGELVIHVHKAFDVRVVENRLNPARPWATIILGTENELGRDGAYEQVPVAEAYMPGEWSFIRGGSVVAVEPLPFDPLVHCFDQPPTLKGGYWGHAAGVALAALNLRLNEDGYSQFFYSLLMQAVGQMVLYGQLPRDGLTVGPGRALNIPDVEGGTRVEYISPNADLAGFRDGIEWLLRVVRENYGIPQSMLDVQTDSSGAAIVQANAPLAELRKARMRVFESIETRLLRSIVAVSRGRVAGIPATADPLDFDVSVSHAPRQTAQSVADQIAMERHELDLGIVTPAELLVRRAPDRFDSVEEAAAELEARAEGDGTDAAPVAGADGAAVQDTALNGAQVAALQELVQSVASGQLPAAAARILIARAFPSFDEREIEAMVSAAAAFEPEVQPVPAAVGAQVDTSTESTE